MKFNIPHEDTSLAGEYEVFVGFEIDSWRTFQSSWW
jgi:hypothetical protein